MRSGSAYIGDTTVVVCGNDPDERDMAVLGNELAGRAMSGEIVVVAVPGGSAASPGLPDDLVQEVGLGSMWAYGRIDRAARSIERRSPAARRLMGLVPRFVFAVAIAVWLVRVSRVLPRLAVLEGPAAPGVAVSLAALASRGIERVGSA